MPRLRGLLLVAQVTLLIGVGGWLVAGQVDSTEVTGSAVVQPGDEIVEQSQVIANEEISEPVGSIQALESAGLATDATEVASVPFAEPAWISVEPIGLERASIVGVGLEPDGTIPVDASTISWYRYGASVSDENGAVIMLAHIAFDGEPGQFARLAALNVGDRIKVGMDGGGMREFAVSSLDLTDKTDFNGQIDHFVDQESPGLRLYLITCGGEFDRSARSYSSFHVATATAT